MYDKRDYTERQRKLNKRCISDDQRNKGIHTYVFHNMQHMAISGDIFPLNDVSRRCMNSFLQVNQPEHCVHVQSGLYPKEVKRVTPNSGSVMITFEQSLTVALVC